MTSQRQKFLILLSPSLASTIIGFLLSVGTMVLMGLSYQGGKGKIYDYLFGDNSSSELISSSRSTLEALNNTILGNATLNKILYFGFWMLIGLIVYIILYAFLRGTGAAAEDLKESNYVNIKKSKLFEDFAIKFVVRLAAAFGWLVFTILFINVLLPFSSLAARNASTNLFSLSGLVYALLGTVALWLSCQIEVILIRLMLLRVRIFSQQEVED